MKTSEFIHEVEKLEFVDRVFLTESGGILIKNEHGETLVYTNQRKFGIVNTNHVTFEKLKKYQKIILIKILTEYIATPIEQRKDKTIEEKAKDYIESYVIDGLSFESARDFLECCSLYVTNNREFQSRNMHTEEQLAEYSAIYDWYHENSNNFIKLWLEVSEHE